MTKQINIGVIGCGFMGRVHSNAYLKVNRFFDLEYRPVLKCVSDIVPEKVEAFADKWGYESSETDWRKMIGREDIDLIDICVPNNMHYDMVMAAVEAGKIVACEKPLAVNLQQAEEMTAAVEKSGKPNLVWFNYRAVPAYALAKQLIDEGRLGRIFHVRAKYLQDYTINTDVPIGGDALWRLDAKAAGSGVTGDLHSHSIDLAMWMLGPIASVSGVKETFIKERKHAETGEMVPVTIDDACAFLAKFKNGAMGTFESTRFARGRKNQQTLEINGENGSIAFDMENYPKLEIFDYGDESHIRGWRTVNVWEGEHPYMKNWWVPGCTIGYEHFHINELADFLSGMAQSKVCYPTFRDGLRAQIVCETVLQSADSRKWEDVDLD